MPDFTQYLNLYKPGGGSTGTILPDETVDIDRINQNMDIIDAAFGDMGAPSVAAAFAQKVNPDTVPPLSFKAGVAGPDVRIWRIGDTVFMAGVLTFTSLIDYNEILTVPTGFRPLSQVTAGSFMLGGTGQIVYGHLRLSASGVLGVSAISASPPATGVIALNSFWRLD